ncbi:MAG TPA: tetratricopeptide repeat protein [Gemmatimonadaceae bacterium]|nr:tetratricopeptide repeat protein [Gemmatimonadaceae bacterium]
MGGLKGSVRALPYAALALAVGGSFAGLQAQRGEAEKPRLLITPFRTDSANDGQGMRAADAVRSRLQKITDDEEVWIVRKRDYENLLAQAGYRVDIALNPADVRLVSARMRADEFLDGTLIQTATGFRIESRLVLLRDMRLAQPLPPVEGRDPRAAGEALAEYVLAARRQLPHERACVARAREEKYEEAVAAARAGIAAYPRATLARLCLVSVYSLQRRPADSISAIARDVLAIDSTNKVALELSAGADEALGQSGSAIESYTRLLAADPNNPALVERVVTTLARGGNIGLAKPAIIKAVEDNPGSITLLRLKWLILLASRDWSGAIEAGEALVRADSSYADTTFFVRLASAYRADGQTQRAVGTLTRALEKFPTNSALYVLYAQYVKEEGDSAVTRGLERFPNESGLHALRAQALRGEGMLEESLVAARRAVELDPKLPRGFLQLARTQFDLDQPDSALASLEQAIANGDDSTLIAQYALGRGNVLYRQANEAKSRDTYQLALRFVEIANRLRSTPQSSLLLGLAAFSVGQSAVTEAPASRSCDLARLAERSLGRAGSALPQGESVAPDAVRQYMEYLGQLQPVVQSQLQVFCNSGIR